MNVKKAMIIPALVFVLGLFVVSVAAAQEGEPPMEPPMGEQFAPPEGGRGWLAMRAQQLLMRTVMEQTGLDRREIGDQLRDGKTLEQIITDSGGDVDVIVAQAVDVATERVKRAVERGWLTQEQADELLSKLEPFYEQILTTDMLVREVDRLVGLAVLRFAGERTGLDPRDILEQMRGGKSLADVLTEHNVDVNQFIEDAVARAEARLNVQVVDERITQERADELLAEFRSRLTERIAQPGLPEQAVPEGEPSV